MKRVGLYFRVSTTDQTTDPQRRELLDYCDRRGWDRITEYSDQISGAKWSRMGLNRLMTDVRGRKLDVVVTVKLDRLGRSLTHLAQLFGEFDACRVALICTSQGIDTSDDNPAAEFQRHILMAVAQFERSLIRERTLAGLAAARARGASLGRPRRRLTLLEQGMVLSAVNGGMTIQALAQGLGCSIGKAHAFVKGMRT